MSNPRQILMTPSNARLIKQGKKWETRRFVKNDSDSCRYGGEGDLLWVRENWQLVTVPFGDIWRGPAPKRHPGGDWHVIYQADDECSRWRPSIHMPRWAGRFILKINQFHQEPLHAITDAGAQAEGMPSVDAYRREWASINGPESWDANSPVWVIRFTKTEPHRCMTRHRIGSATER